MADWASGIADCGLRIADWQGWRGAGRLGGVGGACGGAEVGVFSVFY